MPHGRDPIVTVRQFREERAKQRSSRLLEQRAYTEAMQAVLADERARGIKRKMTPFEWNFRLAVYGIGVVILVAIVKAIISLFS